MSEGSIFPLEPWSVRERGLNLDLLARSESLFALSNGHIGLRGNLDEGEPHGIPSTYAPQLPDGITRLSFTVQWHGLRLGVDIEPDRATYTLRDRPDSSLAFHHNGKTVSVTTEKPVAEQVGKRSTMLRRPQQPSGREPMHRGEAQGSWIAAGGVAPAAGPCIGLPGQEDPGTGERSARVVEEHLVDLRFVDRRTRPALARRQ